METTIKRRRKEGQKNFLPTFLLALITWVIIGGMIVVVDPVVVRDFLIADSYLLFFGLLFVAVFLTTALLFKSTRRGLFLGLFVCSFLGMRLVGVGTPFNFLLLLLMFVAIDFYLTSRG